MFSTFTGSSRRPRNVNLSGQAGNPFTNTSWSPSTPSNASKTVTNAQADREKRQLERQRLKAAGNIQRTWRGHRVRMDVAELRRNTYDEIYVSKEISADTDRRSLAFNLLLSFFTSRRPDDIHRLLQYVDDCSTLELSQLAPPTAHSSRIQRFVRIVVDALDTVAVNKYVVSCH
jgi:ubiquitin-protein ligase E3 C